MGSDDYVIICKVGMSTSKQNVRFNVEWRFKKANWEAFK